MKEEEKKINNDAILQDHFENKILKIYTGNYVRAKNIEKRRNAIAEILPGDITIEITKEKLATDPEVANIAAIMGGGEEVEIKE